MKVFVLVFLLIACLAMLPVVHALDLPSEYNVTKSAGDLSSPYVIFDYVGSPAPGSYDFRCVCDFRLWTSGTAVLNVYDSSSDATTFQVIYTSSTNELNIFGVGSVFFTVGGTLTSAYVSIVKSGTGLTFYDLNMTQVGTGTAGTETVGYAQMTQSDGAGSFNVQFLNSPEPTSTTTPTPASYSEEDVAAGAILAGIVVAAIVFSFAVAQRRNPRIE